MSTSNASKFVKSSPVVQKLRQALMKIDRPGTFCVSGDVGFTHPGLEVTGIGPIGLPLSADQAKRLKKRCEQARYGKGAKTLVDTAVRQVWRMEPSAFSLNNPEWNEVLGDIVGKVQEELGLEKQRLETHLYDLLLYERGCFFLPHRDGERLDRMVATLVVTLPSTFKGGELVVRHDGQVREIDFNGQSNRSFRAHYVAFYADCEHEIRPLKEGYRLCLVYNLTLAKAGKKIKPPRDSEHAGAVRELLREWSQGKAAGKLAITLDHQYTEKGLSWDALKGSDRVKARVLCQAAADAGCKAYLALVTFHESGSAEYVGDGRSYSRRTRYEDYGDDDGASDDASEYDMGEVFDSSLYAEHIRDSDGHGLPIGSLSIDEGELLDPKALKSVKPQVEFEGYTGNAGMELERWYRRAAILLWPERLHFDVLCSEHARDVVPLLTKMVAQWQRSAGAEAEALKAQCLLFASSILSNWPENHGDYVVEGGPEASSLLEAIVLLGERELIERYLAEVITNDDASDPGEGIVTACQEHGWRTFENQLLSICRNERTSALERNVRLVEIICTAKPKRKEGHAELCRALAKDAVSTLQALDDKKRPPDWSWQRVKVDRCLVLAGLLRALIASDQPDLLGRFLAHTLSLPQKYPLVHAHLKALDDVYPWLQKNLKAPSAALLDWIAACRKQLEALTAQEPHEPTDFRRPADVKCKCAHCEELRRFLDDPREEVHRFRAVQQVRRHLEDAIRSNACDVACETERRGSPHTLVCTKTKASFHRAVKKYNEDLMRLVKVRSIEASLSATNAPSSESGGASATYSGKRRASQASTSSG
jgi:hypothetical protein